MESTSEPHDGFTSHRPRWFQASSLCWLVLSAMIIISNSILLASICRRHKRLVDWLPISLAIADLGVGLTVIPHYVLPLGTLQGGKEGGEEENHPSSHYICFVLECLANCFLTVTALCLVALSCDRLYRTFSLSQYRDAAQSWRQVLLVGIIYWSLSFVVWIFVGALVKSFSEDVTFRGTNCPIDDKFSKDLIGAKSITIFWAPFVTLLALVILVNVRMSHLPSPPPPSSSSSGTCEQYNSHLLGEQKSNQAFDGEISLEEKAMADGGIWIGSDEHDLKNENYLSNDLQGRSFTSQDPNFAITSGWCQVSGGSSAIGSQVQDGPIKGENASPGKLVNGRPHESDETTNEERVCLLHVLTAIFVVTRLPIAILQAYFFIKDSSWFDDIDSTGYRIELAFLFLLYSNSFFNPTVSLLFRSKCRHFVANTCCNLCRQDGGDHVG